jgi:hypothetical protein
MKKLILLLLAFVIISCDPCKRLARKCPPQVKDSVIYKETLKEDPNYTIPDSLYWQLEFECDSNYQVLLRDFEESNTGFDTEVKIKEVVRWKEDTRKVHRLTVNLSVLSDSIKTMNRTIEKLRNQQRTIVRTVREEVPVKHTPRWMWWVFIIFIIENFLIAGYIYIKTKKIF